MEHCRWKQKCLYQRPGGGGRVLPLFHIRRHVLFKQG